MRARSSSTRTSHVVSALAIASGIFLACGGSPTMSPEPKGPPPTNTEGGGDEGTGTKKDKTLGEPMLDNDFGHAQKYFDDSASAFAAAGSDCISLCKALASMQRAADHLCELSKDAGDDGKKRCDDAQGRVTEARGRVKSSCGGCGS